MEKADRAAASLRVTCSDVEALVAEPIHAHADVLRLESAKMSQRLVEFRRQFLSLAPLRLVVVAKSAYAIINNLHGMVVKQEVRCCVVLLYVCLIAL